jgi:hypothetical protein
MRWLRSASLLRSILRLVFSYVAGASTSGSCAPPPTKKAKQAAEAAAVYEHLSTHAQHVPPLRVGRPPEELTAGSHSYRATGGKCPKCGWQANNFPKSSGAHAHTQTRTHARTHTHTRTHAHTHMRARTQACNTHTRTHSCTQVHTTTTMGHMENSTTANSSGALLMGEASAKRLTRRLSTGSRRTQGEVDVGSMQMRPFLGSCHNPCVHLGASSLPLEEKERVCISIRAYSCSWSTHRCEYCKCPCCTRGESTSINLRSINLINVIYTKTTSSTTGCS